jgi:hypothetical protein
VDRELEVDVGEIARRVVSGLGPAPDLRADLIQQGNLIGLDLLRTFQPRTEPDAPDSRTQAERYLFVSLRWHLRGYARKLRSSVVVPERDRRLARNYQTLIATTGPLSLEDAATRLGTRPKRLASAIASSATVVSLDRGEDVSDEGQSIVLVDSIATTDAAPEQALENAADEQNAVVRQDVMRRAVELKDEHPTKGRTNQAGRVLDLFLEQLSDASAEIIRLSFGLPRKELGGLPSCRTYGCRLGNSHGHAPEEIARWIEGDPSRVARRLTVPLEELRELLGGRDPHRLFQQASASTPVAAPG